MVIFLIVLMILLFAAFLLHLVGVIKDDTDRLEHVVSILLVAFIAISLGCVASTLKDTPTAMDVYEGKTEMKYDVTIRGNDTIIKDSTVVFKESK